MAAYIIPTQGVQRRAERVRCNDGSRSLDDDDLPPRLRPHRFRRIGRADAQVVREEEVDHDPERHGLQLPEELGADRDLHRGPRVALLARSRLRLRDEATAHEPVDGLAAVELRQERLVDDLGDRAVAVDEAVDGPLLLAHLDRPRLLLLDAALERPIAGLLDVLLDGGHDGLSDRHLLEDELRGGHDPLDDLPLVDHPGAFHQKALDHDRRDEVVVVVDAVLLVEDVVAVRPAEERVDDLPDLDLEPLAQVVRRARAALQQDVAEALQSLALHLERLAELLGFQPARLHEHGAEARVHPFRRRLRRAEASLREAESHRVLRALQRQQPRLALQGDELEDVRQREVAERSLERHYDSFRAEIWP